MRKVIFDTSGLNRLRDDPDQQSAVVSWYERAGLIGLDEEAAREFVAACPPLRAGVMAVAVAHYQYAVPRALPAEYDAGRNDLFMAVYLPYCDWFVTDDPGQTNAMDAIAAEVGLDVRILKYQELVGELE